MGSPCELLSEAGSVSEAGVLAEVVAGEAWRIEDKLSRYRAGNIVDKINSAAGEPVEVDEETAQMLDFAATLYVLSEGAFDITSGVLRRVWSFDGSDSIPAQESVAALLGLVGWNKVSWQSPILRLPEGMEIDLGGIGKEYAVDRAVLELRAHGTVPCLVNFGGDLAVTGAPARRSCWTVGIDAGDADKASVLIELREGALASSGDTRRFLLRRGKRYGHVLDPRTGWPIDGAPASVTVAADTCTQAGMLSTLALLKGPDAEQFLSRQSEQSWCYRAASRREIT
jgi:thiamine biosynthesis lipoprotein